MLHDSNKGSSGGVAITHHQDSPKIAAVFNDQFGYSVGLFKLQAIEDNAIYSQPRYGVGSINTK